MVITIRPGSFAPRTSATSSTSSDDVPSGQECSGWLHSCPLGTPPNRAERLLCTPRRNRQIMTALARNLSLFPGTALTLSITTPTGSVAVHVRRTKQLSQEHFDSIDVALTDSAALNAVGREQHRPE